MPRCSRRIDLGNNEILKCDPRAHKERSKGIFLSSELSLDPMSVANDGSAGGAPSCNRYRIFVASRRMVHPSS